MSPRLLPMGARAVIAADLGCDPASWAAGVSSLALADADRPVDVVPAAETVLVVCRDEAALHRLAPHLPSVRPVTSVAPDDAVVEIPVRYDGADLVAVAAACGITPDDVVSRHVAPTYEVAFCGFAPGFAYLRGLDPQLHLPRRSTPRTKVPAGAVAIAAEYATVYPRSTPGGWHLLGTALAVMFDPELDQPSLLRPGDRVRFVAR